MSRGVFGSHRLDRLEGRTLKARRKSDHKLAMREEARKKVRGPRSDVVTKGGYSRAVEDGLSRLRQLSAEGMDGKAKRVKSELHYLLNNYSPKYDARIQQLIDDWRRSGDPEYDPAIRIQYRQARRDHMKDSHHA